MIFQKQHFPSRIQENIQNLSDTLYGWHIIKLLERKPPRTFEESRSYLESKINQSYLNSLSKKSFVEKLKKEYKFRINHDAL